MLLTAGKRNKYDHVQNRVPMKNGIAMSCVGCNRSMMISNSKRMNNHSREL